ncbi:branched-chain amino acid aminotransferase [Grosmannia clavigera kw1407]|uniref:Branched-chain amino acid aminotransferase n=1 Tax=Grosmannia clavigera (strain kw1407 / UAMH 11150) TaxID=655863 RepID=F0XV57_GROCL|nr:branched-chain amino acid aminotransferase [Grosmannia clavigera kw1407]EFW98753.1 branched-chain amino acid aminotransferase [Grosmannia clavigera kw1407]
MIAVFNAYESRVAQLKTSSNPFEEDVAWVESELVPLNEARYPKLDEGFKHSDVTYDVPAVWDSRLLRLDNQQDRLERSLDKMRLRWPLPRKEVRETLVDMIRKSGIRDVYVESIVARGLRVIKPYVRVMPLEMQLAASGPAMITRLNVAIIKASELRPLDRNGLEDVTRKSVVNLAALLGREMHIETVPVEDVCNCDEIFTCTTAGSKHAHLGYVLEAASG